MLQAALPDCHFLDLFPFSDDGLAPPEIDVGGCDVVQALMVAFVVIVIDEGPDLALEITGQIVIFQQNPILHRLMPALDFPLGLRMERGSSNMVHLVIFQPFGQITGGVTGTIVTQQARHVPNDGMVASGCRQSQLNRVRHVLGPHIRAELP